MGLYCLALLKELTVSYGGACMDLRSMIVTLYPQGSPVQPTSQQVDILNHATGPAWVLAGPGSGKTEVLSLLVLRLLYVNNDPIRSEEHTSELQSLMRISYAVFCLKKKTNHK